MSSIPVISLNVIRQAITWHQMPQPLHLYCVDNFNFPDGRQQATVKAYFNIQETIRVCNLSHCHETSQYAFMYRLQDCFCKDIAVVSIDVLDDKHEFEVTLSCVVEKHDHE